ncbi:nitroreductase [Sphingobacterium sp. lm-10]|uniref:nitroreductase family protein n=1 Tax=Sphingobacterium sp. lm-10 TaxID=2944904 RepID=UPI0020212CAA|nr:nitroreductase [Sphingobacterium sp. lm-10]MCL7986716.1 nitroreductase [Sphingobacterium sp. lm-10]
MKKIIMMSVIAFSILGCAEPKIEQVVYEGTNKEAIIDNILTRRAIRKFTDQQVSESQLDTIMKSAIYAPSGLNKQSWEIRVVQNPSIIEEVNKRFLKYAEGREFQGSAARYREPGFNVMHHAPTFIVIASEKANAYSKLDAGLALQNILLSAHALGLGTCPLGTLVPLLNAPENADILKLLNIPEDYEVSINIALGHPAESPEAPIRYSNKVKVIR